MERTYDSRKTQNGVSGGPNPPDNTKQLMCLCNDNNHCVRNPLPSDLIRTSGLKKGLDVDRHLGHCVTTVEGGCYTVKDIDLNALRDFNFNSKDLVISGAASSLISEEEVNQPVETLMYPQEDGLFVTKPPEFNVERFIHVRYGCLSSHSKLTLSCKGHLVRHLVPKAISCCNNSNFCNAELAPEFMHHSSNFEAYKAALVNHKLFDSSPNVVRRPRINTELNIGPNLLSGGKLLYDSPTSKSAVNSENKFSDKTHAINLVLIVAFSIVVAFLTLTMLGVYYCYKHRLQKRKLRVLESVLWYPSPHSHYVAAKCSQSSSMNTGFVGHNKYTRTTKSFSKIHKAVDHSGPGGCSLHTATTSLTRTVVGSDELQGPQSSKTNRFYALQYTVSKQIYLEKFIGRGRFSDVWLGTWRGEPILAKVFHSSDRLAQSVWRRTTNAYRSMLLRHQSVQGLIAADWVCYPQDSHKAALEVAAVQSIFKTPTLSAMLIGELHHWGTLKDLMNQNHWISYSTDHSSEENDASESVQRVYRLVRRDGSRSGPLLTATDELMLTIVMRLAMSITQGLCFLHSEFAGTRGKPGLAHRDLKPSNIFVKSDWTCCIGDIGFSIRAAPNPLPLPLEELNDITPRYMAPEILSNSISPFCFEAYQRADVYSLSLILWELITWAIPQSQCPNSSTFQTEIVDTGPLQSSPAASQNYFGLSSSQSGVVLCEDLQQLAYQREWRLHRDHMDFGTNPLQDVIGTPTSHSQSELPNTSSESILDAAVSTKVTNEPDLQSMFYLVCEQNLRPRLPSIMENELPNVYFNVESHAKGQEDPITRTHSALIHSLAHLSSPTSMPNGQTDVPGKPAFGESSSSGASSLKGSRMCPDQMVQSDTKPSRVELTELNRMVLRHFASLLPECWAANPDSRLTALRIRKNLQRISDQLEVRRPGNRTHSTRAPTPNVTVARVQYRCHVQSGSSTITNAH
ncbi:TGF-beta receptor type-1 [Clonorchis sinensis]|uniref:receptor protein serine/threonine kinase n=1 Tax=Clonorchis sinensis TaxID=79923 RepID=H2KUX6_CLOSI|nr:TGF-beta receptor type-1 [Clonorchis sinensis]